MNRRKRRGKDKLIFFTTNITKKFYSLKHLLNLLINNNSNNMSLPSEFGYVAIVYLAGGWITNTMIGGLVMKARKKYGVEYPTLYVSKGEKFEKEFNSCQRGHQNMIETQAIITGMALFGAVGSRNFALANTFGGLCYLIGCYLYAKGYATNEANGKGRYKSGGAVKYIGIFTGLVTCVWSGLLMAKVL